MLIFNSKIEKPEFLENLLVGRKKVVDVLEKSVISIAKSGENDQYLLIGNRGSGKTHLIRVLYNRISINQSVMKKMCVAYMAEEEIGIDSFFSFLLRVIEAFVRWSDNSQEKDDWGLRIDTLKELKKSEREERAKEFILTYLDKKQLLILSENINEIFQGMKAQEQGRLRDFIQQTDKINIIATSQSLFADIQREDKPFHNFFHVIHLERLKENETKDLLIKMASEENADELLRHFKTFKGKGQIKAIHFLSEGNHRLIALFFEFLKTDIKSDLSGPFLKTLDQLKPYYESFIRHLPPQQQKIIQFLAKKHQPQLGSTITKECFLTPGGTSKQMHELQNKGFVDAHRIGRDNKYELTEPMMRYCIELTENRDGIIGMFARFISVLYSDSEIINKYLRLKYLSGKDCKDDHDYNNAEELSIYIKAGEEHTQNLTHIESIIKRIKDSKTKDATVKIMMLIRDLYSNCSIRTEDCTCNQFLNKPIDTDSILKTIIVKLVSFSLYEEAFYIVTNIKGDSESENITIPVFFLKCLFKTNAKKDVVENYLEKLSNIETDKLTHKLLSVLVKIQKGDKQAIYELTKDERVILEFIDKKGKVSPMSSLMLDIRTTLSKDDKESLFKQLLSDNPANAENHISYANFLSSNNSVEDAEKHYLEAIKLEPDNAEHKYTYGLFLHFDLDNDKLSAKYLKKAIENNTDSQKYWLRYASVVNNSDKAAAQKAFQKMELLFPTSSLIFEKYGKFLYINKEYDVAIEKLEKAIELDNENDDAYELQGDILMKKNKYDIAIEKYSKALIINDSNYTALLGRGMAYFDSAKYKDALKDFEEVIQDVDEQSLIEGINHEINFVIMMVFNLYILGIINNKKKDIKLAKKYLDNSKLSAELNWAYTLINHIELIISNSQEESDAINFINKLNKIFDTKNARYSFQPLTKWIESNKSKRFTKNKKEYLQFLFSKIEELQK